jgi:DNA-directed RNA polymerase specialized sigma24 family protein
VSTRSELSARATGADQAEEVALVAEAARRRLLAVHRHLLRWEDLEDCYSQATCELVAQARNGELRYRGRAHLTNTLQLRFASRIADRRRASRGRSPSQALLDDAVSLGAMGDGNLALADPKADVERRAILRFQLRRLEDAAAELTPDQRLVLACQIGLQMSAAEFCRRFDWSEAKHHKVAQRARARLRQMLDEPASSASTRPAARPTGEGREGGREIFFAGECPGLPAASEERAGTHL